MRETSIKSIGMDMYEVTSKKEKVTNSYIVDLRSHYCSCKGWFYSEFPKTCTHIKSVIQLLRAGGHCIQWDKKEHAHYDLGLINDGNNNHMH